MVPFMWFPLSKVLHLQERAIILFQKNLYSSSNRLFSFTFLAVVMHHMHERAWARNQPSPVKMKPSSETIICMSFARSERKRTTNHDCLSYSRPYLCHRLLVIRVRVLLRYFVMFNLSLFKFVLEYFLSIECNLPAAVHEKLLDTRYLA